MFTSAAWEIVVEVNIALLFLFFEDPSTDV